VKNGLEIVPVRWIDKVLEIALERMPTALPEDTHVATSSTEIALAAPVTAEAVKH
jgi:ATP-dependent Lon protease